MDVLAQFIDLLSTRLGPHARITHAQFPISTRFDALLHVVPNGSPEALLAIEVLRTGYPRDAKAAIEQLTSLQTSGSFPHAIKPMVVAHMLSPGARALLRSAGVNYHDAGGTTFLQLDGILIDIERAPKTPSRPLAPLFRGANEQVVHAILHHWRSTGSMTLLPGAELANLAMTSTYTVSRTLGRLEREGMVHSEGSGPHKQRTLHSAQALLDNWTGSWSRQQDQRSGWYLYSHRRDGLAALLAERLAGRHDCLLTAAAPANAACRVLTSVERVDLIVPSGTSEQVAHDLTLERADKGANVFITERQGAALLFPGIEPKLAHATVSSPFIQYMDLLDGHGRHIELARSFRMKVLGMDANDEHQAQHRVTV